MTTSSDGAFGWAELAVDPIGPAPDGMDVFLLTEGERGGMAQFRLPAGQVARAIRHHTIEELWFILEGEGEVWFDDGTGRDPLPLRPGVALRVPPRTPFQVRAGAGAELRAVGATMPPWPGDQEAEIVSGAWPPTVT